MNDPADLSNLRDIIFPSEVPLRPLAPGWWIVGVAIVASAIVLASMAILRHRRNAYRRAALGALANIEHLQAGEAAQRITAVLKRAALVAYPRVEVAALSGEAWLGFLDHTGHTDAFTAGPARSLPSLAFGGSGETAALPAITSAARDWVRRHRC